MQFSSGNYVMNICSNKTVHISLNVLHKAQCCTASIKVSFQINHDHEVVPKEILHIFKCCKCYQWKETRSNCIRLLINFYASIRANCISLVFCGNFLDKFFSN